MKRLVLSGLKTLSRRLSNACHAYSTYGLAFVLSFALSTSILANPVLDNVAAGNVTINQTPNSTVVNQTSPKAIINWQSFNIGKDQSTHFQQPAGGIALNRINPSQGVSQIYGRLTATGQIILVNPAGIFFAPGSYVNVGGLIASTATITDANFLNNYYHFSKDPNFNGAIINQGTIIAANNGLIALVGGAVSNEGLIEAHLGNVVLAAGDAYTMTFAGNDLVSFAIDSGVSTNAIDKEGNTIKNGVSNSGSVIANGGSILMTAKDAAGILDNVINMSGIAQTFSVMDGDQVNDGEIFLLGEGDNGLMNVTGTLDASSNTSANAGTIIVKGYDLLVGDGASFNVSSAQGDGGFIDTSGKHGLGLGDIAINTATPNGNAGTWLIDPADINITTVDANITGSSPFTATATAATLNVTTLLAALASGDVIVRTTNDGFAGNGDITVSSAINWSSQHKLTLDAFNNIIINAGITATNGSLDLQAGALVNTITTGASGTINVANFNLLRGTWTQVGALPSFNVSNNFQINSGVMPSANAAFIRATSGNGTSGTPYVIADVYGLQGIGSTTAMLTGANSYYLLGGNVDASGTATWNSGAGFVPIGTSTDRFQGNFNGQNYTISNLYINRPSSDYIGLFGAIYLGVLDNLNMANVDITGRNYVGATAGELSFQGSAYINDTHILSGTVSGETIVGGLLGAATGSGVSNSSNAADVFGTISGSGGIGGLVGNVNSGFSATITNSYNTGNVTVPANSHEVGGLVGMYWSEPVSDSYNTGNVIAGNNSYSIGGLIGWKLGVATNVFSTGSVTSGTGSQDIGGLFGRTQAGGMSSSYSSGAVTVGTGSTRVGGFAGYLLSDGSISNSYSVSAVTAPSSSNVGGLIGHNDAPIQNAYSSGYISATGSSNVGGLIGFENGTTTNSFWDTQTSNVSNVTQGCGNTANCAGVTGITTTQMMTTTTFSVPGWSIANNGFTGATPPANTWIIFEGRTRPMLESEWNTTIATPHQLQLMAAALGNNYNFNNHINLAAVLDNPSEVWGTRSSINSGNGFYAIGSGGSAFTGSLNGQNYTINGLYMRNTSGNLGLFANINSNSTFQNIHLTNININSSDSFAYVGGFAGQTDGTYTLRNISSTGTINAANKAGGLVGFLGPIVQGGLLTQSFSTVTLNSGNDTGGIAGANFGSTISESYFGGSINNGSQATSAGGILGYGAAGATISNSYNYGSVSSLTYAGGMIGYATGGVTVSNSVSTGAISGGSGLAGGLIGSLNFSTLSNSFWDADTSLQTTPVGANNGTVNAVFGGCFTGTCTSTIGATYLFGGSTYADLSAVATYTTTLAGNGGSAWNITSTPSTTASAPSATWFIFEDYTRPLLISEHTTTITNAHQLQMAGAALGGSYTLQNNLDLSTIAASDVWGVSYNAYNVATPGSFPSARGFAPIGNNTNRFSGSFDGQEYTIHHLVMNTPTITYVGLFGATSSTAALSHIAITNPVIYGSGYVGAIAGDNAGTISNSYATSNTGGSGWIGGELQVTNIDIRSTNPTGSGYNVGGIAGQNTGTITDSHTRLNLFGGQMGGIAGINSGTVSRSYSASALFDGGYGTAGGIAGNNTATGSIINSFFTGTVSAGYYSSYYGGLVGYNSGLISKSYNLGGVNPGFLNGAVGGLVGYNDPTGNIINSYNAGYIAYGQGQGGPFGGVAGSNAGIITNVYSYATTYYQHNPSGFESNGFVGSNSGTINNSFWDIGTSGYAQGYGANSGTINGLYGGCFGNTTCNLTAIINATNAGGTALDLTKLATYTTGGNNWDMSTVWNIIGDQSYPYLRDFYGTTPRAVSGYHPSLSRFQSVSIAYNNAIKDTYYTYNNGFSYFLEGNNLISGIDNSIADGIGVLIISNSGILANYATYAPSSGASISGVNGFVLTANTVTGGNSETNIGLVTPLTNSQIVATRGTLVNGNILFTGSGNNITISNGYSFATTAATPYSLDGNIAVTNGNLTFNGTLAINMASASLTTNSSGNVFIYNTVNGNNNALTINTVGTSSAVTGAMSNLNTFTKSGSGVLTLSGANNYSGTTNVTSGTLIASHNSALGSAAAVINGGTLKITGGYTISNALSLSGTGAAGTNGALDTNGAGTATASGAISLANNATIGATTGGLLNITNTINGTTLGTESLTLGGTGNLTLGNTIGVGTALLNLTANMAVTVGGSAITTTGTQTFNNALTLAGSSTLTSSNGNIVFGSTINGTSSGAESLTVNAATGDVTYNSSVGNSVRLNTLTTTAGGTSITFNNAPTITTSGDQIYNSFVSLTPGSPTTFVTTGAGNITFNAAIGSGSGIDFANNQLITNAAGQLIFNSNVGSGPFQLSSVDLTAAGGIYLNNNTVSTNGAQTYRSPVHLTGTVHFTNYLLGDAQFQSTIDGPGSFTSNFYSGSFAGTNPQVVTFGGAIGANTALNNFNLSINQSAGVTFPSTIDASGAITINASGGFFNATSTPPNVVFNGAVGSLTIPTSVTVSSSVAFVSYTPSVTFNSTVNTSGALAVSAICLGPICTANGPVTMAGTIGTLANPVGSIAMTGSQINLNMDYAYSTGAQAYTGPIVLNAAGTTALISNTSDITASSTVAGNGSNTLLINNAGANSMISGAVSNLALVKNGAGRLILANNNTYTGGTTINTGILQVGNGGATGSITGNITNETSLVFNTTGNFTYSNTISSIGSVTQNGTGAITFSGLNSYSGGTTLNAGVIVASHNSALGTGNVAINNNSTLRINGAINVANAITLNGTTGASGMNGLLDTNGGGIATASGAITLAGNARIGAGSGATLDIANTINGITNGGQSLTTAGAGTVRFSGAVGNGVNTALSAITANSPVNLSAGTIRTTGAQAYNSSVTLGADNTLISSAGSIGFGALTGAYNLVVNAGTSASLSSVTGLQSLTMTAPSGINYSTNISTIGDLIFNNPINFTTNFVGVTLQTTGGGNMLISGDSGTYSSATYISSNILTIRGSTNFTYGSYYTASNYIDLSGSVTSGFGMAFNSPLRVTGNSSLTNGNGGSSVSITSTIDGPGGLTIQPATTGYGGISLNNAIGSNTPLSYLTISCGNCSVTMSGPVSVTNGLSIATNANFGNGAVSFNGPVGTTVSAGSVSVTAGAGITFNGYNITTSGSQVYNNIGQGGYLTSAPITIAGGDVNLTSTTSTISFTRNGAAGTIDSDGVTPRNLTLNAANGVTFSMPVGTTNALNNLTVTGLATINSAATTINTRLNQTYNGGVSLGVGTTLSSLNGGDISFGTAPLVGVVNGAAALVVNTSGNVNFNSRVGFTTALTSLNVTGATFVNSDTMRTSGAQTYNSLVTLGSDSTFTSTGNAINLLGNITSDSTARSLTLTAASPTVLTGNLGVPNLLNSLTVTNASTIGAAINTLGAQTFGGAMTLSANSSFTSSTGDVTISSTVNGGNNTLTVNNAGASSSIAGIISNVSDLIMAGGGSLTLTGNNAYTGTTHINSGTLRIGNGGATGALGSGTVTNNSNLIFNRNNSLTVAGVIDGTGTVTQSGTGTTILANNNTYSGGTTISAGTLQIGNAGLTGAVTGNILNNSALVFNTASDFTLANVISGTGSVSQSGSGIVSFTGLNSYSGQTSVNSGTLAFNSIGDAGTNTALGNSSTAINIGATGTLQYTGSGHSSARAIILTGSGGTLDASGGGALTLSGGVTGNTFGLVLTGTGAGTQSGVIATTTGTLTKNGTGTWTLSNANTYSGSSNITAGTLEATNSNALGSNTAATISNSTLLLTGAFDLDKSFILNSATISANTASATNTFTGTTIAVNGSNTINVGNTTLFEIDSLMTGSGLLTKTGLGTFSLAFTRPAYNGDIIVDAGLLATDTNTGLGSTAGSVTINANGSVALDSSLSAISVAKTFVMNGGTLSTTGSGNSVIIPGTGSINLASGTNTIATYQPLTVSGVISGSGNLAKTTSSTLTLAGVNTYSGTTDINGGTLFVASSANLGDASGTNNITFNGGTLTNTGAFSTSRTVNMIGNGTIDNAANLILDGVVSGSGALTKSGASTLILANNNTYSGGTTIGAGTLQIGNSGSTGAITGDIVNNGTLVFDTSNSFTHSNIISGTGSVTQQGTGTITLGGDNTFDGVFNINSGSIIVTHAGGLGRTTGTTVLGSGATLLISGAGVGSEGLTLNGGTFGGAGNATFGGAITLNADANISNNGGNFTLNSSLSGAHELTFSGTGTTALFGTVGGGVAINNITANTALTLGGSQIITSGNQTYNNTVTTTNSTLFRSTGTGSQSIVFNTGITGGNDVTLDGAAAGSYTFTLGSINANHVAVNAAGASTNNVLNLNTAGTQNFTVSSGNTGSVTGIASVSGNFNFSNIHNINGGSGADNFTLSGGTISGSINGGAGTNSLTGGNAVSNWNISSANGGSVTGIGGSFSNIHNLTGGTDADVFTLAGGSVNSINAGAGADTLIANNTANTWTISSNNGGAVTGVSSFSNIENVTGGSSTDNFTLAGGTISGNVDGGAGTNSLVADNVTNTWSIDSANGGTVTGVAGTFANIQNLTGGTGDDTFTMSGGSLAGDVNGGTGNNTLVGANSANNWAITANDTGTLTGIGGTFASMNNLTGGTNLDIFNFSEGAAITGLIDGGDITNLNQINFNSFNISWILNLVLGMPVGGVIDAGLVYDGSNNLIANFARVQMSNGNNVGYITLPNEPSIRVTYYDSTRLNGEIADPFYYFGWIIGNPPIITNNIPSGGTPATPIAAINNQPVFNQDNEKNFDEYYLTDTTVYTIDDGEYLNLTEISPLLTTTSVNMGTMCYAPRS